jgi:hypothetical protein
MMQFSHLITSKLNLEVLRLEMSAGGRIFDACQKTASKPHFY